MSIVNQIPPVNLNPVLISLQDRLYSFSNNRDDIISEIDNELEPLKMKRDSIERSISEAESDIEYEPLEVTAADVTIPITDSEGNSIGTMKVKANGCDVGRKNKRKRNIINAFELRKNELTTEINSLEKRRNENKSFYDTIIGEISNIIKKLLDLLRIMIANIEVAIQVIEVAIASLSAIPLGAGVAAAASLGFIGDLLQIKIFEPVSDTISQQERYDGSV